MRRNITISIEDMVLDELDIRRGDMSRGDYIGVLLSGASEDKHSVGDLKIDSGDKNEIKDRVKVKEGVPVEKEVKLDKLVKSGVVKRGVKELPSQDVGGLKTYFKG